MEYQLNRLEYMKDSKGTVAAIFTALHIQDDAGNSLTQEYYLSGEEQAAVLADETALKAILEEQAAIGVVRLEDEVANRPQPTVFATESKKSSFVLDKGKIDTAVTASKDKGKDKEKEPK